MNKDSWKDIKGYEGLYQVSSSGRIKSLSRTVIDNRGKKIVLREKVLKCTSGKKGYTQVSLRKNSKTYISLIHRLVAEAFIPNPENKPEVHHKNHIRDDNRVENLEWVTYLENRSGDIGWGVQNKQLAEKYSKSVTIDGIFYKSYSLASTATGINRKTIGKYIENNDPYFKEHIIIGGNHE